MEICLGPAHWSVFVGNLSCFLLSVIINSSAMKVFIHKSMSASLIISLGKIPRRGIAENFGLIKEDYEKWKGKMQ